MKFVGVQSVAGKPGGDSLSRYYDRRRREYKGTVCQCGGYLFPHRRGSKHCVHGNAGCAYWEASA